MKRVRMKCNYCNKTFRFRTNWREARRIKYLYRNDLQPMVCKRCHRL